MARESLLLTTVEEQPGCVIGEDYAGMSCATGVLYGTHYEIRVEETNNCEISDNFLAEVAASLVPANKSKPVSNKTFNYASAVYFSRYPHAKHGKKKAEYS